MLTPSRSKFSTKPVRLIKVLYVVPQWPFYFSGDDWTDCFRVEGISLPINPFVGISALTGEVYDAHEYVLD